MELNLRKIVQILRDRWWVIVLFTILLAVIAFFYTKLLITPKYTSTATLYVLNTQNRQVDAISINDLTTAVKLVDTYIVVMESDLVMGEVARTVGGDYTAQDIRDMFTASSEKETEVLRVNIENEDPARAQEIANAILKVAPAEIIRVIKAGTVEVLDAASLPQEPSSPNLRLNVILGALIGLLLSVITILLIDLLNLQVKEEQDLTELFTLPIIGAIPIIQVMDLKAKENL